MRTMCHSVRSFWRKWLTTTEGNSSMEKHTEPIADSGIWILCDIDGTIADDKERLYIVKEARADGQEPNWDLYHEASQYDVPMANIRKLVWQLSRFSSIAFVTARPEKWRELTQTWLSKVLLHTQIDFQLYMRADDDLRSSVEVKRDILLNEFDLKGRKVWLAIDNHPANVDMFRANGIETLQAGGIY